MTGPRLYIAMPVRGGMVHAETVASLFRFARNPAVELAPFHFWNEDLCRVRARYVHAFLESDASHLLFLDSDVAFSGDLIERMLAERVDFIGAAYPKKKLPIEWPFVRMSGGEMTGTRMQVHSLPMGCTLLSRECLQEMVGAYGHLSFADEFKTGDTLRKWSIVGLFNLVHLPPTANGGGRLLPEDYSFCYRWVTEMKRDAWLLLGDNSTAQHVGNMVYGAHLAGIQ